jgi:hypothetical protein
MSTEIESACKYYETQLIQSTHSQWHHQFPRSLHVLILSVKVSTQLFSWYAFCREPILGELVLTLCLHLCGWCWYRRSSQSRTLKWNFFSDSEVWLLFNDVQRSLNYSRALYDGTKQVTAFLLEGKWLVSASQFTVRLWGCRKIAIKVDI